MQKKILTCRIHSHGKIRMFCKEKSCYKFICQFCSEQTHRNHCIVDLDTLCAEINSYERQHLSNREEFMGETKQFLEMLNEFNEKLSHKHKQLHTEKERLTYKFEKLTQRMIEDINTKRDTIFKSLKELHTKLESCLYDTLKQTTAIKDSINYVKENFEEENIKNLLLNNNKCIQVRELSGRFMEKVREIGREVEGYEMISALSYYEEFPSMHLLSVSNAPKDKTQDDMNADSLQNATRKLDITSNNETPMELLKKGNEVKRQREVLLKLAGKITDGNNTLECLNRTIEVRKKEIESLNNTKAKIIRANDMLMMSIERQNKRFADVADALTPERAKCKNITPERLFAREPKPTTVRKPAKKLSRVNKTREQPQLMCDSGSHSFNKEKKIEFTVDLEDLDNFIRLITDSISSTVISLNIFVLSSRCLLKPESSLQSNNSEVDQTLRALQEITCTVFKVLERTLSGVNENIERVLGRVQEFKIVKQIDGGFVVSIDTETEESKLKLEQLPEGFGHFLFDMRKASTELLKALTEASSVLPLMESQIKRQIGAELELLDARTTHRNWEVDTIPECNEEISDSTQRLESNYVTFSKRSSRTTVNNCCVRNR
eukprot:TRINITY_DN2051_c0_g1_i14.p1 TRINITY_DN2051_c0_g1~~TRINITY_DN2051_c0_g1_i14.p1  ORF type:complete len:606 (-),score=148.70 TRINITY_DN2051_c0_g1_i14:964-2781(-)